MGKALIISLNFHPGHVSHMVASYRQLEELGYESVYCVTDSFVPYLPKDSRVSVYGKDDVTNCSVAMFVFPSHLNLLLIRKLKRYGSKILYIFHEPLAPLSVYRKAGFSYKYLMKLWVINKISCLTVKWSDVVFLPSKKAEEFYYANPSYKNGNVHYIPLMYDDERKDISAKKERQYFSYIGTVAADHSFNEYLRFVEWAIKNDRLSEMKFLIATKSEFDVPETLGDSSRVRIIKGTPLSDADINECYASSYVVWNAYVRTTQSGVLAKSFMFGTPAIVLRKNLSEFTVAGHEVVAIDDNTSCEEIEAAVICVTSNFGHYSSAARKRFEEAFYYRKYNDVFKKILDSL